MRQTGIDFLGSVPWGTHFCQFYQTPEDLVDVLVPYFASGLAGNEFCMWVTSAPLSKAQAKLALGKAVKNLDQCIEKGQIEILDYTDWYTLGGSFDSNRVLHGWIDKLEAAERRGFDGMRLTGNTFWLEKSHWSVFTDYEAEIDRVLAQYRMLALCTYSLDKCGAAEIMDVVSNHEFALIKRSMQWDVIQSSERLRAKKGLHESERRYRELFESMDEGFALHEMIFDSAGRPVDYRFLEVNPAFERLTGRSPSELIGRTLYEVFPDADPSWVERYGRVVTTRQSERFEAYWPPVGKWYSIYCYSPAPGRFAVAFSDVTERRRAEQALAEAKTRAEHASEAKDRFLASLSHELRTPLTPVLVAAQMLERLPGIISEARDYVRIIKRNVGLEARLIDDLLDLTRIEHGKVELRLQPVDVHEAIRAAASVCSAGLDDKHLQLTLDLAASQTTIVADPDRFQQICWNLLVNAAKFSPERAEISIETVNLDSRIRISVADHGMGIAPECLPRIFDAFEQGRNGARAGGLGLGLAITKSLCELQNGKIEVFSPGEGQGSTFVVTFPLAAAEGTKRPSAAHRTAQCTCGKILLVEDHLDTATLVKTALELSGHEVVCAGSVSSALAAAARQDFDLLLCDLGLPDGSGVDLIQSLGGRKPKRAAAISGYGQSEDIKRCREAGFDHHLTKPINLDALDRLIESLLSAGDLCH